MPNISFDIFFDKDFINVTAARGKTAPKAKPEWKVRTAPKLPPKETPNEPFSTPRPPPREKLTHSRQPAKLNKPETNGVAPQTGDAPKRKPPKLGPKKDAPKPAPKEGTQEAPEGEPETS